MNRFKAWFYTLLAIAWGFGLAHRADAQTTTGKISGRITDANTGEPPAGCQCGDCRHAARGDCRCQWRIFCHSDVGLACMKCRRHSWAITR